MPEVLKRAFWLAAAVVFAVCLWQLESERATVSERMLETSAGPVSIYRADGATEGPLVLVTHGFAGSRQMMQYISRDLARAGYTVAAFDFIGHGRSPLKLSPDVTRIEGTTRQLVDQTRMVTEALRGQGGFTGPMAMLGHSMATDIIIRAATETPEVAAIVAISMYSDAITEDFPQRLLVISGAWEGRLRDAGLRAVHEITPSAQEGETVRSGAVVRRTVSVPGTEHVAVLFSPVTLEEARDWLQAALPTGSNGETMARGPQILALLFSFVVLIWPLARLLPSVAPPAAPLAWGPFLLVLLAPVLPAMAAGLLVRGELFGLAGFGGLLAFFAVWGLVALAALWRVGRRPVRPALAGVTLLLLWALGGFALALDRYGAAFLPVGPRLPLMVALLIGTVPFALADRLAVAGASPPGRLLARILPIVALAVTMMLAPGELALLFTVLPVLALHFVVFGTMARAIALRSGPDTAAWALSVILAWSIAASTPLFLPPAG